MPTGRYVLKTISHLVTSRLLYRVAVGISVIMSSRYLINDPALADTFEIAVTVMSIVMIGSEVGMSMVLMRSGAKQSQDDFAKHYGTALWIETIAWNILLWVSVGGYALLYGLTPMFWLLLILGLNQAIIQYRVVVRSIYRSLYANERITYIEVVDGLSKLVCVWLVTHLIDDRLTAAYSIASAYALTTFIFIAIYAIYSFRLVRPRLTLALTRPMLSEGMWYSLQAVIMTIYFEVDKLMLRLFQQTGWANIATGDVARYGAAARIIVFFLIFHRIGLQVITPYLYASFPDKMERYRRIVQFSTRYMSAAGIGLGVGMIALAPEIIQLIYGPKFAGVELALQLFALFFIVRFIGITSSQVLATTGNQPKRTKQEALGVGLNVILDCIFIPLYGFLGGAIATLSTEVVVQTVFFVMTRRLIKDKIFGSLLQIVPALLAGGVMGVVVYNVKDYLPIWLTTLVGGLLYGGLLFVFRFFNAEDKKILKQPKPSAEDAVA